MNNSYTITGLMPSTDYEVQVCRASRSSFDDESAEDNCGWCLLCFHTTEVEGVYYIYTRINLSFHLIACLFRIVVSLVSNSIVSNSTMISGSDQQIKYKVLLLLKAAYYNEDA